MRKTAFFMAALLVISIFSVPSVQAADAAHGMPAYSAVQDVLSASADTEEVETKEENAADKAEPSVADQAEPSAGEEGSGTGEKAETDSGADAKTDTGEENQPLDISQGTVPFIDDTDPLMENLAVYMVELKTGTLIHSRNAERQVYPASLTKIMTAILTLEKIPDLDRKIRFTADLQNYVYEINLKYGGQISTGGIALNEELTAEQLLYAIMLPSANEAAVMLANEIGEGSLEYFAELMNEKAKELGCKNTNFVNSNGLFDENHYTTAYDMYLITKYALENEKFRQVVNTPSYETGETNKHDNLQWNSTNSLIVKNSGYYYPEVTGVKTGSLDESGKCLISTAQKDGYEYLLVLIGAPINDANGVRYKDNQAIILTQKFYDWAFENYKAKTIVEKGENVSSINQIRLAKDGKDHLQLMSGQTFSTLLPSNIDVSNVRRIAYNTNGEKINTNDYVTAPVKKGTIMGELRLMLYGSVIGKVDLVAAEDIEVSPVMKTLDTIANLFKSTAMKFLFLFLAVFLFLYTMLLISRNQKKKKIRKVNRRRKL